MKRGVLSIKAINQYRRRDVVSYLGLRYYLDNSSACKDRWIEEVSTHLALGNKAPSYFKSYHFKGIDQLGNVNHRAMYLPGPNEILAETALIVGLSKYDSFNAPHYVFSYLYAGSESKSGVFEPYFHGYKKMHAAIASACKENQSGSVMYTDIQKFYPSISNADAVAAWNEAVSESSLSAKYKNLGDRLLDNHRVIAEIDGESNGLLTGPMLSHVIANLVLSKIDKYMFDYSGGRYWRYVDDIVFVGDDKELLEWREILSEKLNVLGLNLHTGDKDFRVDAGVWLGGEGDFDSDVGVPWISLIADIKRYLLSHPDSETELKEYFEKNSIRIPVSSYSQAVKESTYINKLSNWISKYKWSRGALQEITIERIVNSAVKAKNYYMRVMEQLLDVNIDDLSRYEKKRLIPKLRYYSGRLLLLLGDEELLSLSERLSGIQEMLLMSTIMRSISTRDVSDVVRFGENATQSAAQLLRISKSPVTCNLDNVDAIAAQSLAILELNGVCVEGSDVPGEFQDFARGENILSLMKSSDGFVREVASLHGVNQSRHTSVLDVVFDHNEELVFDVLSQIHNSSHAS